MVHSIMHETFYNSIKVYGLSSDYWVACYFICAASCAYVDILSNEHLRKHINN